MRLTSPWEWLRGPRPLRLDRILFSHQLVNGLGCATGVFLIALTGFLAGGMQLAAGLAAGGMVASIADIPCPPGGKLRQLALPILLCSIVSVSAELAVGHPLALAGVVLAVSFVAPMLTAFGRTAMPMSFSLFLSLMFAMATPHAGGTALLAHSAAFLAGGALYLALSVFFAHALALYTKQQVFADTLHAFADFMRTRARVFDSTASMDQVYLALIREQAILTEKLQTTREFVFRRIRPGRDAALAAAMIALLDAYESALSSDSDRPLLREHFGGKPVSQQLAAAASHCADEIDRVALDLARNRRMAPMASFGPMLAALRAEASSLAQRHAANLALRRPLVVLEGVIAKIGATIRSIEALVTALASEGAEASLPDEYPLQPFITRVRYRPELLLAHLHLRSPVFRFTLRTMLAMSIGFVLAHFLPYAAHGYWILMTIAVVLRASFSQTRQRHNDRILGTFLGCLLTGALLHVTQSPLVVVPTVFLSMAIAHAFVTLNYRYTSIAACVMGLLQLHLLAPSSDFVMLERIVDTLLGGLIAYACSFVLPNWEQDSLPTQVRRLLEASRSFIDQALTPQPKALEYRLARRALLDGLAALTQAIGRMTSEPASRQHPLPPLNALLTHAHGLVAQLASVRILLLHRGMELDAQASATLLTIARNTSRTLIDAALAGRAGSSEEAPFRNGYPAQGEDERAPLTLLHKRLERAVEEVSRLAAVARASL